MQNFSSSLRKKERERAALAFIVDYRRENGVSPTRAEIADHMGYSTRSSVDRIIKSLEEQGDVRVIHGVYRGVIPQKRSRKLTISSNPARDKDSQWKSK